MDTRNPPGSSFTTISGGSGPSASSAADMPLINVFRCR